MFTTLGVMSSLRTAVSRLATAVPDDARDALRPLARRLGLAAEPEFWWQAAPAPWVHLDIAGTAAGAWGAVCNICRWRGSAFRHVAHVESANCPQCGSIARDRFLFWCFATRTPKWRGARVLETSPRLGLDYREWMRRWFAYRASDFDLSAHRSDIQIDLQQIDLPDAALDIVLSAHVLEHVPDTRRALGELFRVIAPGGRMYLQVPLMRGRTAVPLEPEFHADNTPVFFNFGWELTDMVRAAGFETRVLVPGQYLEVLRGGRTDHDPARDGFDLRDLVDAARVADLVAVTDATEDRLMGFEPAHQHATWECLRPA